MFVFLWSGAHIGFPRESQASRFAGVLLVMILLQMFLWYVTHKGARP